MTDTTAAGPAITGRHLPWVATARRFVAGDRSRSWSVWTAEPWCRVAPAGRTLRRQGWKLHVSATPGTAAEVLERTLPVLISECATFKFAADREWAAWLVSPRCPRHTAGKFLTVYPADDDHFRRLAAVLDTAVTGLSGPRILSDRPYRPGSLVHYRYGGFVEQVELDDDGRYRRVLTDPAGRTVEDRREAWFTPPSWAEPVLPEATAEPGDIRRPVLLDGRFLLRLAVRHSSRGGVFLGSDTRTGVPVVVKQARAHMDPDPSGEDCRDRLRREAELLRLLAPARLAPRPLAVVEAPDRVFLVREYVAGTTLRGWVARRAAGGVPVDAGLALARALVSLVAAVHRAGVVLVDVSPDNVVVDPAGIPFLIDLDRAAPAGTPVHPAGTPGYSPPEHRTDAAIPALPQADLFGLGGLLFFLAVGADPRVLPGDPPGRPAAQTLLARLDLAGAEQSLAARLAPSVAGLMRVPLARPAPCPAHSFGGAHVRARARAHTDRTGPGGPPDAADHPHVGHLAQADVLARVDRLVADGVVHLVAEMTPQADRLWPPSRFGAATDPYAVQHGAAGVLAVLVRAAPHATEPDRVGAAVSQGSRWLDDRLATEPRHLPGLYFGRAGTAWALHDATRLTGDRALATRALDLAARVPVEWPNPDVAHGAAGAGLAQLHLWRAGGDQRFRARLRCCADALLAAVRHDAGQLAWPIPPTLRSTLAGRAYHGYAHGTAGVGAFLLAAGVATGQRDYVRLARDAAQTLAASAVCRDGAAFWPVGPGGETHADPGWCKGSAGIGTFLLRAWRVTGESGLLELARAAAAAAYRSRFRLPTSACHGLAGVGQYLLDLADALDEPAYRDRAWDLARLLAVQAAWRHGRLVVPDDSTQGLAADYGVGLAGVVDFLVRLRHGGPRPWTAEP